MGQLQGSFRDGRGSAAQLAVVDERIGHRHDVSGHAVLRPQRYQRLRSIIFTLVTDCLVDNMAKGCCRDELGLHSSCACLNKAPRGVMHLQLSVCSKLNPAPLPLIID